MSSQALHLLSSSSSFSPIRHCPLLPLVSISNGETIKRVERIKSMLESMEDGEISMSAYDTAWVALVEDINGSGAPQFPSSLQWIADNQLPDGSWGDALFFTAYDRIINTLACVIALKSWNLHLEKSEKGIKYFKENLRKLEDENAKHMPAGFEVGFSSLLERARKLHIDVPEDSSVLKLIYASRNIKIKKIPMDIMHEVPTTQLYSLEGMAGLEWEKLLKLQCRDGSFLFSPSSTAYALTQTKDPNSLNYLNNVVQRFKGGVPSFYPLELFERIWAVDRLQRLGISRFFELQLKECINYVARCWREDGISWTRNSVVHDMDDTNMGFRLLRLYGHDVSPDVFKHFKKGDTFFCFAGESSQSVTVMFNLFRASQLMFPGEKILEEAYKFSYNFLRERQAANDFHDKWVIAKDLPGEVKYALDVPWYASLPRVESRFYIEQYGGENDVWISKILYRMPCVSNNEYLELAKIDYNNCQAVHRVEWDNFQKWYGECNLGEFGVSKRQLLLAYFLAAASIFEPERSKERLAWAMTTILVEAINLYFNDISVSIENRRAFVQELFKYGFGVGGIDISHSLHHVWENFLLEWEKEGDRHRGEAELIVKTINLTTGHWVSKDLLNYDSTYERFFQLINSICYKLGHYHNNKVHDNEKSSISEINPEMQELVQLVYQTSDGLDSNIKQAFFTVTKSFYYSAIIDLETINYHISKVLFETVF